jgi:hypothetical protein
MNHSSRVINFVRVSYLIPWIESTIKSNKRLKARSLYGSDPKVKKTKRQK